MTALDGEERRLFADRIRALDRRIMPGVTKLSWLADKHALEFYCKEARRHCHLADNCVTGFKAGLSRIEALCKSIAEGLLIDIEKKKLYELADFEAVQSLHHQMVSAAVVQTPSASACMHTPSCCNICTSRDHLQQFTADQLIVDSPSRWHVMPRPDCAVVALTISFIGKNLFTW